MTEMNEVWQDIRKNYIYIVSCLILILLCMVLLLMQTNREEEINKYWKDYINDSCVCVDNVITQYAPLNPLQPYHVHNSSSNV